MTVGGANNIVTGGGGGVVGEGGVGGGGGGGGGDLLHLVSRQVTGLEHVVPSSRLASHKLNTPQGQ